ncbi:hypothetical protein R3W88_031241 [Solanum pinnatisectum]|uniref:DUF4283 domain-containing protein n=1 Tax=Solanum pinnatisectum TaxID=50273 RepID=A0AAV9LKV2_9SOLN|nr:hypothetical protein R3W88_031241 [Solanum pinnatisectum]
MIINENLEYAVIGKFSYGWSAIQDLRKLIPKQCELKGECNIGLLSNRHVLIRATLLEDYADLLSKSAFYITQRNGLFPMRTWKWDSMFNPEEETSTTIAWISFPSLPPNFFGKEAVFSLAAVVGKPLQVDMATKNQTRPSCARVKVWTKVGLITGNKFAALNKENVEQKNCQISKNTKGNEKCADEVQRTIPGVQLKPIIKPFRFLNFWTKHHQFKKIISQNWNVDFVGSPFVKETQLKIQPSERNRVELHKLEAELKKYLRFEEEFWKQKAGIKWFSESDMNTKKIHSYVKGKRKKLHISAIESDQGITIQSNEQIGEEAVKVFTKQFTKVSLEWNFAMLENIH